jgi:uncharacterized protein YlxP (DUF503 family)
MKILIYQIDLYFQASHSLKEKRGILKSFQNQIRKKFNVSIAEIDYHDVWQSSRIGIVMTANEIKVLNIALTEIQKFIENNFQNITIVKEEIEFL